MFLQNSSRVVIALCGVLSLIACSNPYGEIVGNVTGTASELLPIIYAHNTDKDIAYTVYVIDGEYRAVNLLPGNYDITMRTAVGQLERFDEQTVTREIASGEKVSIDFNIENIESVANYVGGIEYPDADVAPYDEIYPPGPGRDALERTCHGCHTVQFFAYNKPRAYSGGREPKDRDAWAIAVDRKHKGAAFGRAGKASIFDPAYLPEADRNLLVDYLALNFPADGKARVVRIEAEPDLDKAALKKAMFIEYIYREPAGETNPWPSPHQIDFDHDGNVWLAYTGCCVVRVDPRTGDKVAYGGHGGGHGIAIDKTDGTVWYSGRPDVVRRLDPSTGLVDNWQLGGDRAMGSITQAFDSKGDLWLSLLGAGGIGKWDREADDIVWWEVPVLRARPYGITVDHDDKIWSADFHNGGVTRFDPETEAFTHFPLVVDDAASSIRRLGVDSTGMIWAATWGSRAFNNVKLFRLDPENAEVTAHDVGLPYGAVYNAEADSTDNIWITPDNYLSKFDQETGAFTHYPIPVRSDTLKTTITRDDAVWFTYHNAGRYSGYGGSAVVLYPDKDKIPTLAAFHSDSSTGNHLSEFNGAPGAKVQGRDRVSSPEAQNADEYQEFARAHGLLGDEGSDTIKENQQRLESLIPKESRD